MKILSITLLLALASTSFDATAAGRVQARGAVANPDGGVSTGQASAGRGPNGGAYGRGSATTTDGQGNASNVRGGAARTAAGGYAGRGASTTVAADGSVEHAGSAAASGPRGQAASSGGFTRSADGRINGSRSTSATGAAGNSYDGQTTVTDNQVEHSHSCTNAAGAVIPCR